MLFFYPKGWKGLRKEGVDARKRESHVGLELKKSYNLCVNFCAPSVFSGHPKRTKQASTRHALSLRWLGDDDDERVPLRVSLSSVWEFGFGIGFFYQHFDEHCSVSVELETAKCE